MEDEIKKITVEIDGETYGLEDALGTAAKKARELQDELEKVEELLKFDPRNIELLTKKQKLLASSVEHTKNKLGELKEEEALVQKQFKKGSDNQKQYQNLQQQITQTETKLKGLQKQAKKTADSMDDIDAIPNIDLDSAATGALSGAYSIASEMVNISQETRDFREDMTRLETSATKAGAGIGETEGALKSLNTISSDTDSNINALCSLLDAGFAGNQMDGVLESLSGAVLNFPDSLGIEELASGLKNTLETGQAVGPFAELLENMGLGLEDFDTGLRGCTTSAEQQQYILDTLANTGLAKVNDQYQKTNESIIANKNAQFDLQQSLADLGAIVEPMITTVTEKLSGLVRWITENKTAAMVLFGVVTVLAAGLKGFLIVSTIVDAFKKFKVASEGAAVGQTLLNKAVTANPIGIAVVAIMALVGAIMYLWNTNEDFRNFVTECWNNITEAMKPFIDTLINFFTVTVPQVFASLLEFAQPFIDWLINFFTVTLPEAFAVFSEAIRPIVESIMNFFTVTIPEIIKPFVDGVINFFIVTLPGAFGKFWEFIKEKVEAFINFFTVTFPEAFQGFLELIGSFFTTDWSQKFGAIGLVINGFVEGIKQLFSGFKLIFTGVINFIRNVFEGDWKGAWESVVNVFGTVFDAIKEKAKIPINGVINILNNAIGAINTLINGINDISIKIPDYDWIPKKFRGAKLGFDIPEIKDIPLLAKGGVLSHGEAIVAEAGPELIQMINGKAVVTPLTASSQNRAVETLDTRNSYGGDIIVNNYSPKALTAAESARCFKRAQRELALGVR